MMVAKHVCGASGDFPGGRLRPQGNIKINISNNLGTLCESSLRSEIVSVIYIVTAIGTQDAFFDSLFLGHF